MTYAEDCLTKLLRLLDDGEIEFIWPAKDLGRRMGDKIFKDLGRRMGDKIFIRTQMTCGCPVGRVAHPPGPCGITGIGQERAK